MVLVSHVEASYNSSVDLPLQVDLGILFKNNDSARQSTAAYMALIGALIADSAPGVAFFLWFQEAQHVQKKRQAKAGPRGQGDAVPVEYGE